MWTEREYSSPEGADRAVWDRGSIFDLDPRVTSTICITIEMSTSRQMNRRPWRPQCDVLNPVVSL